MPRSYKSLKEKIRNYQQAIHDLNALLDQKEEQLHALQAKLEADTRYLSRTIEYLRNANQRIAASEASVIERYYELMLKTGQYCSVRPYPREVDERYKKAFNLS